MENTVLNQIDAQSALILRQLLINRAFEIDHLYPLAKAERARNYAELIHLIEELGMDANSVLAGCPTV